MESNTILKLKVYRQQLSPFGKSVFKTLVKHWKERQSKNTFQTSRVPPQFPQKKKMLAFRSDEPLQRIPNVGIENQQPKQVPKSFDLVTPVDIPESLDITNTTKDNLITSAIDWDVAPLIRDELCHFNPEKSEDYVGDRYVADIANKNRSVDWNNMFDTELFLDISIPTEEKDQPEKNYEIKCVSKKDTNAAGSKNNCISAVKDKLFEKKRKTQTKITDTYPKKVKKPKEIVKPKTNFRKQNYSKSVKNWLNDVDPSNPVEEEVFEQISDSKEPAAQLQITKEANNNANKKVVQTRLANKDGIMKFGLEKNIDQVYLHKDMSKNKDNVKQKKPVSKFMPPIKSQIRIRDVTYEIITVDESTDTDVINALVIVNSSDVSLVLCYSNGYSQLNIQHTDESCIPEGLMVHVHEKFYYFKEAGDAYKHILSNIMKNNKIICYEGKHILNFLKSKYYLEVNELNIFDAKIACCLLNADSLPETFSDLQKLVSFVPQYTIATECVNQKTAWYMTMLGECWAVLHVMLVEETLWKVFVDIEMRLLPIIAEMEYRGVCVDIAKLTTMEEMLLAKIRAAEQECYKAAGKSFQIKSTAQVRVILYDELKLDTKCNVMIRETICKGAKSTSENMLRSMMAVHPLPKLILEYRHLHKAHATFVAGISQHVKNGVVKPTWVQMAAATGRIASNNPNLQAIPKAPFSLVMFPGSEDHGSGQLSFRSVYISRAGHSLLAADFKHIECRVFAHAAADTSLLEVLKSSQDFFKVLAAKWLNKPVGSVSAEDRERTKRTVYASLYGAGGRCLMDVLRVTYDQALDILTSFNRTFPSLRSFGAGVVSRAARGGGRVCAGSGRARRLGQLASSDAARRAHAERQAVNFVVQGTAADLCKMAMVLTARPLRPLGARLLLQVHDELVWELPDQHLPQAAAIVKQVMENCGRECGMDMTLPVAMSSGRNWGEMAPMMP